MNNRDRLVELIKEATKLYLDYLESIDEKGLIDTEGRAKFTVDHLIANGVIVSPCKVGDTVYVICNCTVQETSVFSIKIETEDEHYVYYITAKAIDGTWKTLNEYEPVFRVFMFGKTVFLTREEAERELKEREGE